MRDHLYLQLARALLAELASGLYGPERRFLSNRKVRRSWGVAWATAASSLNWLVEQGLLRVKPRSGYYTTSEVQKRALALLHGNPRPPLPTRMSWETKRFRLNPKSNLIPRRIAVIVSGIRSHSEALKDLPSPAAGHDLGLESARSLFREATRHGCTVQFYVDNGQTKRRALIVDQLLKHRPDGVIAFRRLMSYAPLQAMMTPILAANIPAVTVFDDCEGLNMVSLNINNVGLGYEVVRRFLRLGHHRIAVLVPRIRNPYFQDRAAGARLAMAEAQPDENSLEVFQFPLFRPVPSRVVEKFRDPRHRPTALFVTSATLFDSLWPLLRRLRLRVPRDISIITAARAAYRPACKRSFDTMKVDFPGIGKMALAQLIALLEGTLERRCHALDLPYLRTGSVQALRMPRARTASH